MLVRVLKMIQSEKKILWYNWFEKNSRYNYVQKDRFYKVVVSSAKPEMENLLIKSMVSWMYELSVHRMIAFDRRFLVWNSIFFWCVEIEGLFPLFVLQNIKTEKKLKLVKCPVLWVANSTLDGKIVGSNLVLNVVEVMPILTLVPPNHDSFSKEKKENIGSQMGHN